MRKIKCIIALLFVFEFATCFSQLSTTSPYSRYGIGILRSQSLLQNFSLGGTGLGLRSNRDINISNPASYSEISITTFEAGFINNFLSLDDGNQQQSAINPYINHIAFAFPIINKKWGMSFGLLPLSHTGYSYSNAIDDPTVGSVTFSSEGEGGLNKAYFGNGVSFKTDSLSTISFGVNGTYIFGITEMQDRIIYGELSNGFNTWDLEQRSVSDVSVDFGTQYQKVITRYNEKKNENDIYRLTLGATVALATDLSTKRTELVRTFTGSIDFGTIKDTIVFNDEVSDLTSLPLQYGVGFSIAKENKWLFAIDYKAADWGAIGSNNPIFNYVSNYSIAAGFEIVPKYNDFQGSYFNRVIYRFGARYSTSYISVNNQDFDEYGITFGVKLPLRRSGSSIPAISLGMEYGSRGKAENNLIKETFCNFNVGITINDRWFQKRKYD